MRIFSLAASAAALVAISAPAQAAMIPATFNFAVGNNNNLVDGNSRTFSATSSQFGTFNVRVTAWSLEDVTTGAVAQRGTYVRDAQLTVWDLGLGVQSNGDGSGNNQHTIDNGTRKDFIVLQFDRPVMLQSATFSTFAVGSGSIKDSDATIKYGNTNIAWNTSLASTLNNKKSSVLDTFFTGGYTSLGGGDSNTRAINPNQFAGNVWLIGADFVNADGKIDGFKLTNLAVIPEPATWAMMIGGFGFVGAAARRRKAETRSIA